MKKLSLALSLMFFAHAAVAAVVGKDVEYKAGDTL